MLADLIHTMYQQLGREDAPQTWAEVAARLGVRPQTLAAWGSGSCDVSDARLIGLVARWNMRARRHQVQVAVVGSQRLIWIQDAGEEAGAVEVASPG